MSRMLVGVSRGKHEGDLVRIRENLLAYKTTSESEVSDAVAEVVKRIQIEIAPIQDKHGYSYPWPAGGGKNLYNYEDDYYGEGLYWNTNSGTLVEDNDYYGSPKIPIKANTTYKRNAGATANLFFDSTGTFISKEATSTDFTTPANAYYVAFNITNSTDHTTVMLVEGSSNIPYEPYSNICPISGHTQCDVVRTGKNLFDASFFEENGIDSSGANNISAFEIRLKDIYKAFAGKTYAFSYSGTASYCYVYYYKNGAFDSRESLWSNGSGSGTFTVPNGIDGIRIKLGNGATPRPSLDANFMLEFGSSASTYEAYQGNSHTYPFSQTVYGGTLELYQDGSGKVTVDFSKYALPLTGWTLGTNGFYLAMPSDCISQNTKAAQSDGKCTHFALVKDISPGDFRALDNVVCYCNGSITDNKRLYVRASQFADASAFETYLSAQNTAGTPVEMTYVLATPVITYLSASEVITLLSGYNTLYASTGSIQSIIYPVERYADAVETDERFDADEAELSDAQDDIVELAETKAPVIVEEVTTPASVMSFSDGADNLPMKVVFGVEPVQDLHGYDYPWVGGAGKNLLELESSYESLNGVTYTSNPATGIVTLGGSSPSSQSNRLLKEISVTAGEKVFISGTPANGGGSTNCIRYIFRVSSGGTAVGTTVDTTSEGEVVTVPETATVIGIYAHTYPNASVSGVILKPFVAKSETALSFEPYANICPISGHTQCNAVDTGKNLFDYSSLEDGGLSEYGSEKDTTGVNRTGFLPCPPNKTLVISNVTNNVPVYFYDESETFILRINSGNVDGATFTTPANAAYMRFASTAGRMTATTQVEIGSTPTTFEPFGTPKKVTYPFSQTVYGGTLTVNRDGSGSLIPELVNYVFNGTDDEWTANGARGYYCTVGADYKAVQTPIANYIKCLENGSGSSLGTWEGRFNDISAAQTNFLVKPDMSLITTVEAWEDFLEDNPLQVIFKLANPTPVQLTNLEVIELLKGCNNIWCDTGNVLRIEYSADTKMYIDNLGQTEEDYIANANIASGDYFQVGNTLYIATSAIASGERIIPGTNCSQTTIADVLNADATGMSFGG